VSNWQPIDTAPTDGTKFLGFVTKEWIEGFSYDGTHFWYTSDGDMPTMFSKPTHWMPWPESQE